jgi:hypothetical protein
MPKTLLNAPMRALSFPQNIAALQQRFPLGDHRQDAPHCACRWQEGVSSMVRELQLLTVGFVFAFLGAIVMGVF